MLASLLLHNPNCHARCRRGGGQAGPPAASAAGATAIGDMTRMPRRLPPWLCDTPARKDAALLETNDRWPRAIATDLEATYKFLYNCAVTQRNDSA